MAKFVPNWYLYPEDTLSQDILSEVLTFRNWDPFWKPFTSSTGAVKYHKKNIGAGGQDVITFLDSGDFTIQYYNDENLEGKERDLKPVNDTVKYDEVTIEPILKTHDQLKKIYSPVDFAKEISPQLEGVYADNYEWHMAGLATFLNTSEKKGNYWNHSTVGVKPVYDRICLQRSTGVVYPTRAEYNDGGGDYRQISGANGILRSAGMLVQDNTRSVLEQFINAKDMANSGGATPLTENIIRGISITREGKGLVSNNGIALVDSKVRRIIEREQKWIDLALKPLKDLDAPDLLRGSLYMGTVDGTHFYEYPWLSMHRITDNAQTFAFCMYVGQECFYQGETPYGISMINQKYNYGKIIGFSLSDIRAYKAMMRPSKTGSGALVETGLIHVPVNITNML